MMTTIAASESRLSLLLFAGPGIVCILAVYYHDNG